MHDQLHAARFIEETLQHQRLLRRDRAKRSMDRREIVGQLLRAGSGQPEVRLEQLDESVLRSVAVLLQRFPNLFIDLERNRETASDNSSVRPGASPSQKGMPGGWPCASSTRTMPELTRRIRHEALPSWKISPAILSTAKSSLTVPMNVSLGSRTTR